MGLSYILTEDKELVLMGSPLDGDRRSYSNNIIDIRGNLLLIADEYTEIKSYDDKMVLAKDKNNNIKLVNSTLSVTVTNNDRSNITNKSYFYDNNMKENIG